MFIYQTEKAEEGSGAKEEHSRQRESLCDIRVPGVWGGPEHRVLGSDTGMVSRAGLGVGHFSIRPLNFIMQAVLEVSAG